MERGTASLNYAHYILLYSNWKIHRHNLYQNLWRETSGFRRDVAEVFVHLRCYATLVGSMHQTFGTVYRYHLQGSGNTRNFFVYCFTLKTGRIDYIGTSVLINLCCVTTKRAKIST